MALNEYKFFYNDESGEVHYFDNDDWANSAKDYEDKWSSATQEAHERAEAEDAMNATITIGSIATVALVCFLLYRWTLWRDTKEWKKTCLESQKRFLKYNHKKFNPSRYSIDIRLDLSVDIFYSGIIEDFRESYQLNRSKKDFALSKTQINYYIKNMKGISERDKKILLEYLKDYKKAFHILKTKYPESIKDGVVNYFPTKEERKYHKLKYKKYVIYGFTKEGFREDAEYIIKVLEQILENI